LFHPDRIITLFTSLSKYAATNDRFGLYTSGIDFEPIFLIIGSVYDHLLIHSPNFRLYKFFIELSIFIRKWELADHQIVHYVFIIDILFLFVLDQLFVPFLSTFSIQNFDQLIYSTTSFECSNYPCKLYVFFIKWFLLHIDW